MQIGSFEERFRTEVNIIQQHYKQSYKEWKASKKEKYRELKVKYDQAVKKGTELEAICME